MSDALPDIPDLDASKVSGASFGRSRKGFEPTEVRKLLGRVADALRVYEQRDGQLVARVEDLSRRLDEAEEFDEDRVTEILGAETARIVAAARSAATEMRGEAERESKELLDTTRAEAEKRAADLVAEASQDREAAGRARSEAESAAAEIVSEATESAEKAMASATAEAEETRTSATAEAESLTSAAKEESERLRSDAQSRHDEMIEAASSVLGERTAEAQEAADALREKAEAALADAEERAATELDNARTEAQRLVAEARDTAAIEVEQAREKGREMVAEAREVRQRMLRDLAEKSRAGRQKVEAAKAARAGVVDAIRGVVGNLEQTLGGLDDGDRDLKRLADAAAAGVPDDVDTVARELEAALEGASDVDSGVGAGAEPDDQSAEEAEESPDEVAPDAQDADSPDEAEDDTQASAESGPDEVVTEDADLTEEVGTDDAGADEADGTAAVPGSGAGTTDGTDSEDTGGSTATSSGDANGGDGPARGVATAGAGSQMASVHDLFEKLRSDDDAPDVAAHPAGAEGAIDLTEDDAEPSADSAVADGNAATSPVVAGDATDTSVEPESTGNLALATEAGEQSMLDRRDELLAPAERLLARNLKRLVGDEQNEVLDRARRIKRGRAELEDLLSEDASTTFVEGLAEPYLLAAAAGAQMWSELSVADLVEPAAPDVQDRLAKQVAELLELRRVHVREALEQHDRAGADPSELVDEMRAAYRELRATSVPELAADLASGGFNSGISTAAGDDATWKWIPDNGGLPCADAEDNALQGPIACGADFPTGDSLPPAHPGCRCILVPESADQ